MLTPTFIVTGMYRSGTTAMMRALWNGMFHLGVRVAFSRGRDRMLNRVEGDEFEVQPGSKSLLEIPLSWYEHVDFPVQVHGCLSKVMLWGIEEMNFVSGGVHIIMMTRNPDEIIASYRKAFPNDRLTHKVNANTVVPVEEMSKWGGWKGGWGKYYWRQIKRCRQEIQNRRRDVLSFTEVPYDSLITDPQGTFEVVRSQGWPIREDLAAKTIEPRSKRVKHETDPAFGLGLRFDEGERSSRSMHEDGSEGSGDANRAKVVAHSLSGV